MFVETDHVGLFPTLVFRAAPLPGGVEGLEALIQAAAAQIPAEPRQAPRRRSQPALHREQPFQALARHLAGLALEALALSAQKRQDCVVSALWAETAAAAWREAPAAAPNAHLAFLLPLAVPEGMGLRLADPRPQAQVILPMVSEPNQYNAREVTLELVPGQALLLPGWLPHAVVGSGGTAEALLLRGQSLFRNMAEAISPPMWTGMTANRG